MALKYELSNEIILATRQEFLFTKVAPVQSINYVVLLDFWLMLLFWIFISSYTIIYIFRRKIYFFECFYFSKYDMSLDVFGWEKGHQLSTHATVGDVYVRTYTISFIVFGKTFAL